MTSRFLNIPEYSTGATGKMHKSLLVITSIFIVCLALIGCGPAPYEIKPHQVSVKATQEAAGKHIDSARLWAVSDDAFIQAVLEEITNINNKAGIVSGQEFMATVFPGKHSAMIEELASEEVANRIRELSVTHIILIEHKSTGSTIHGKITAAATIINTERLYQAETLSFDAEGHRVGIHLPLPFIFLIFPYSDPDMFGSATGKIADTLSDKILEDSGRPLTLTILTADNLTELINTTHEQQTEPGTSPPSTNPVKRWKNPLGFYSDMMSDAREKGEVEYYSPLAHIQFLLTSIIMAPTMVVVDAFVDEDINVSTSRNLTTLNTEQEQFGYALEAIKREDWEAGYRLLEDFVISDDEMLRVRTLQLFKDHPELLAAAPDTFSRISLELSRDTYGTSAIKIEKERLDLYERVAQPEAYSRALENFNHIFQASPKHGQGGSH